MDSIESARAARKHLNNTQILSDGTRINVLVSNKQRIDFQDKNPAGIGKFYKHKKKQTLSNKNESDRN